MEYLLLIYKETANDMIFYSNLIFTDFWVFHKEDIVVYL